MLKYPLHNVRPANNLQVGLLAISSQVNNPIVLVNGIARGTALYFFWDPTTNETLCWGDDPKLPSNGDDIHELVWRNARRLNQEPLVITRRFRGKIPTIYDTLTCD